ncbi:hypothetical protein ACHAQH_007588 [Verticillium albo-atrum]
MSDCFRKLKQILPRRSNRRAAPVEAQDSQAAVAVPEPVSDNLASPASPPTSSENDIALSLWSQAYKKVKEKDKELVEVYDKILTWNINDGVGPLAVSAANMFANCAAETRIEKMAISVRKSIDRAQERSRFRSGVIQMSALISKLDNIGKAMLTSAPPPAIMAWSGICAVMQLVSGPFQAEQSMLDGLAHVNARM